MKKLFVIFSLCLVGNMVAMECEEEREGMYNATFVNKEGMLNDLVDESGFMARAQFEAFFACRWNSAAGVMLRVAALNRAASLARERRLAQAESEQRKVAIRRSKRAAVIQQSSSAKKAK